MRRLGMAQPVASGCRQRNRSTALHRRNSHTPPGETMSIVHRQPSGTGAMGGLLQAVWRYKWLVTAAVLVGALLGYGWAARQPTLYAGVSRVILTDPCPPTAVCVLPP